MPSTIKIRRGLEANRTAVTPAAGEFLFTTDNKKVFIGDGSTAGGIGVGGAVAFEQSIKSVDYTLVLQDAGKQIFHPASDVAVRTYTIPANSAVPFPIGTVLQFAVDPSGVDVNIAINDDTLVLGSGVTGTIRLDPGNILTAIKITSTKWLANYEYQFPYVTPQFVAVAETSAAAQYVNLYPWTPSAGFGTRYPTPGTVAAGNHNAMKIAPNGSAIADVGNIGPFVTVWALSSAGYGAKFANPATLPPNECFDVAWHPEMTAIAVAHSTTPFVTAYPWSAAGFGVKYANPTTLPGLNANGVAFSPAGNAIFVAELSSPFIDAYAWNSSTGFGTKYANPATLPASSGYGVAINPAGDAVAVAHNSTPFVSVYPWNSSTGFGTKFTNPVTLPTGNANAVAFNPTGTSLAVGHATSPFVSVYPWSVSGFGTKYGNAGSAPAASTVRSVAFSAGAIFTSEDNSPYIRAWQWNVTTGFGTAYSNPATLPGASTRKLDYNFG